MSKQLTPIDVNADTFGVWLTRMNELIAACNAEFVTANTNANGSVTVGNVYITGKVYADTLSTSELRGGNVQTSANLSITSNVVMNTVGTFLYIGNSSVNVFANSSTLRVNGVEVVPLQSQINVQTSGTTSQLFDSVVKATYRGAEYLISISDNAANNFQMQKIITFHDSGADAYITDFGLMYSNNIIGSFTANSNTTHIRVYVTPTVSNTQVKATKTVVAL